MLEQLVATLEQRFENLTAEEIADILWLTLQQWQSAPETVDKVDPVETDPLLTPTPDLRTAENSLSGSEPAEVAFPERTKPPASAAAGVTTRSGDQTSDAPSSELGSPLAIPDSKALRRSLDILRAIRPLIRSVPSVDRTYLDVPETVRAIAETDLWLLKVKPVPEPWLELALVIDATPSMVIWQRALLQLRRVLAQSGVFRDVRLWSLETEARTEGAETEPEQPLCLRSGFGAATVRQVPCRPEELLDPSRRRLILVVSDCIDLRWDGQPVRDILRVWAKQGPMGLVQVLPEWLWSRTALSEVTKGQLVAQSAGQPSQSLRFVRRGGRRRQATVGVKVPVMTLEPAVVSRWSQMVAGRAAVSSPGLVFSAVTVQPLVPEREEAAQGETMQPEAEPTAEERIAQFRDFSSPVARRLVGLLAACPEVNLPVIRMVQAALLPESQQVHVAEVLLGGLFHSQTELSAHMPADQVQYDFHPGVRTLVQHTVPPDYAFQVLSAWLSKRFDCSLADFRGYLVKKGPEAVKPFAGVMLDVLRRRRRDYAELIQQVEQIYESEVRFPPLESFDFIDAQLVESGDVFPPPLKTEEFTVVTFEQPSGMLSAQDGEGIWKRFQRWRKGRGSR